MTARNKNIPALRFKGFEEEWESKRGSDIFISSRKKGNENLPIYSVTLDRGMVPRNSLDRSMLSDAKATDSLFVAKNDIAYNMMRMWQGAYGLSPENCMVSPAYVVLHPKANMSPDFFIEYFARSRSLYLFTAYSYGLTSDRLRLYFKDFAQIKFNVPKFPEQQKIASFLSAIDEKIRQLSRRKELLEQYKKGVMQQLFSGKLRFKDENGKAYPKWEEKRLGDVCQFFSGGTPKSTNKKFYSGNIPFIGSGNIYDSEVSSFISEEALNSSSAKLVKKGDLLFALYGANSGEVAISKINGAINQAVLCIRSTENVKYIYNVLLFSKDSIVSKFLQGGQGNLSANIVKQLKFKFPSITEQERIVSFLSSIDTKIESVAAQIEGTKGYKKGLLQKMFV